MDQMKMKSALIPYCGDMDELHLNDLVQEFADEVGQLQDPTGNEIQLILRSVTGLQPREAKFVVDEMLRASAFTTDGPKVGMKNPVSAGLRALADQMEHSSEILYGMARKHERGDTTAEEVLENLHYIEKVLGSRWLDFGRTADSMERHIEEPDEEVQLTLRWENPEDGKLQKTTDVSS